MTICMVASVMMYCMVTMMKTVKEAAAIICMAVSAATNSTVDRAMTTCMPAIMREAAPIRLLKIR